MANQDLLKLGRVTAGGGGDFTIFSGGTTSNSFIRFTGQFVDGSTTVTVTAPNASYYGIEYIRPGFLLRKTGQGFTDNLTEVISVDVGSNTIVIADAATANSTGTTVVRINKGLTFVQSGSLITPSGYPTWRYTSVTGSQDSEYNTDYSKWAALIPLALTSSDSATVSSVYGVYDISEITDRISNDLSSFYISASVAYPEPAAYTPSAGTTNFAISETTLTSSIAPLFHGGDIGVLEGLGFAAAQNQIVQFISQNSGSSGGSVATFPYTGSAQITGSLAVTGSSTFLKDAGKAGDFFLIQSASFTALKSTDKGVITFGDFTNLPTAVDGGFAYSGSNFYAGIGES